MRTIRWLHMGAPNRAGDVRPMTHQRDQCAVALTLRLSALGKYLSHAKPRQHLDTASYAHSIVASRLSMLQGDAEFERARTGDPLSDWDELHALSVRDPDLFWSALLLQELRLVVQTPPTRYSILCEAYGCVAVHVCPFRCMLASSCVGPCSADRCTGVAH